MQSMNKSRVTHFLLIFALVVPNLLFAQIATPVFRSFEDGEINIKVLNFGPDQYHLTVQSSTYQTRDFILNTLELQANALCQSPAVLLNKQVEPVYVSVLDVNGRSTTKKGISAFGVALCKTKS
jgi:hypothetical protein